MIMLNDIVLLEGGIRGRVTATRDKMITVNGTEVGPKVEGVPITAGFLLKNGWKERNGELYIGSDFAGAKIREIQPDCWQLNINNQVYSYGGWISFVHEIQHAMEDCALGMRWKL